MNDSRWHIALGLLCLWVLWQHGVGMSSRGSAVDNWEALDAYEAKTECSKQSQEKEEVEKRRIKNLAEQKGTLSSLVIFAYPCLPDTLDPRAPKPPR
jgi:hypothetical protein